MSGFLDITGHGQIRITPSGEVSVFDLIQVCAEYKGAKSRYNVWNDLCEQFSEVYSKIIHFKFPGRGQKETPVCDKETALQIIGLLPGLAGKKYRELAAKTVLSLLENPAELAKAAIAELTDKKDVEDVTLKAYAKYINTYHPLFDELKERSGGDKFTYIETNTVNTETVLGASPKEIKAIRGGKTAREHCTVDEYSRLAVLQDLQKGGLVVRDAQTPRECREVIREAAVDFKELLEKYGLRAE